MDIQPALHLKTELRLSSQISCFPLQKLPGYFRAALTFLRVPAATIRPIFRVEGSSDSRAGISELPLETAERVLNGC